MVVNRALSLYGVSFKNYAYSPFKLKSISKIKVNLMKYLYCCQGIRTANKFSFIFHIKTCFYFRKTKTFLKIKKKLSWVPTTNFACNHPSLYLEALQTKNVLETRKGGKESRAYFVKVCLLKGVTGNV